MAVAKLHRIVIIAPRPKLGELLTKLLEFSWFHPSEREGFVQIPEVISLVSKVHEVFSDAGALLDRLGMPAPSTPPTENFHAPDVFVLVDALHDEVMEIMRRIEWAGDVVDASTVVRRLQAIRKVSSDLFLALRRFRFLPGLRRFIAIEGFTPSERQSELLQKLTQYYVVSKPVEFAGPHEPYTPTLLSNPKLISLFEEITLSYGPPRYRDIDPTPLVAIVFPLLFGLIIADLGRGLMLLMGSLAAKYLKQSYWSLMLSILGLSASIFGLLSGNFLGIRILEGNLTPHLLHSVFTIESITFALKLALFVGTVHLASAYLFSMISRLYSEDYVDGILFQLPTFTLYSSSVALALSFVGSGLSPTEILTSDNPMPIVKDIFGIEIPIAPVASASSLAAAISLLILILGRPFNVLLRRKSITQFLKTLYSSMFDMMLRPIEFLSNTLSYMRLGVLMILDRYLTYLVGITLNLGFSGILPFVILNIAVTALEGFMVYIQDLRLHIYEWIPKAYLLGTPFKPLLPSKTAYQIMFGPR